jgi:hypothetical protein
MPIHFPGPTLSRPEAFDFECFSDTFLTLAAVAPLLPFPVAIHGIGHTRFQETDRIHAMTTELRRVGAVVEEGQDFLRIHPFPAARGPAAELIDVQTYRDHRVAMSLAVLGSRDLNGNGKPWLSVMDPSCCSKTFPGFSGSLKICIESVMTPNAPSEKKFLVIAIDGGAASGKSSTARALCRQCHFLHVDTGSHYRAVALACLKAGVPPTPIAPPCAAFSTALSSDPEFGHMRA